MLRRDFWGLCRLLSVGGYREQTIAANVSYVLRLFVVLTGTKGLSFFSFSRLFSFLWGSFNLLVFYFFNQSRVCWVFVYIVSTALALPLLLGGAPVGLGVDGCVRIEYLRSWVVHVLGSNSGLLCGSFVLYSGFVSNFSTWLRDGEAGVVGCFSVSLRC